MAALQNRSLQSRVPGDIGIPARLRAIYGGLYPQSDLVVANDPIAIAARTWIDDYAQLDRAQPTNLTDDDWIAQNPEVKSIIDELNGKFWPNIVGQAMRDTQKQVSIVPAAEIQREGMKGNNYSEDMGTDLQPERQEGKRKWWQKF